MAGKKSIWQLYNDTSLIIRIVIGMVIGSVLALIVPKVVWIGLFGRLFVRVLKSIAPILVFVLVIASLTQGKSGIDRRFGYVIALYLISTLLAGIVAVIASFCFPLTIKLFESADVSTAPTGLAEVLTNILLSMADNPVKALFSGNYISILFWSVLFGIMLRKFANESTKQMIGNIANAVSGVIGLIIAFAPFGVMGL
ncbi:MAG: cation:dicarboxylase symporter family transporter, partial [Spirochaetales bacterium]|nr:cation:dicarboxylase symporter family transporter [Spirochaetales bacterium]